MKTIFKNGTYNRVEEVTADSEVKHHGWKFVPKSEWKTNHRDFEKAEREAAKAERAARKEVEKK